MSEKYVSVYAKNDINEYFAMPISKNRLIFINEKKISYDYDNKYQVRKAEGWLPQMEKQMRDAAVAAEKYLTVSSQIEELKKKIEELKKKEEEYQKAYFSSARDFTKYMNIYFEMKKVTGREHYVYSERLFSEDKKGKLETALAIAIKSHKPIYYYTKHNDCNAAVCEKEITVDELIAVALKRCGDFADVCCLENEIRYYDISTPTRFD